MHQDIASYVSLGLVEAHSIVDTSGRGLFPELPGTELGTLIFIDLEPEANWAHKCVYVFVSSKYNERREGEMPPREPLSKSLMLVSEGVIDLTVGGPWRTHNEKCPVCQTAKAVYDLANGAFYPCWDCQRKEAKR